MTNSLCLGSSYNSRDSGEGESWKETARVNTDQKGERGEFWSCVAPPRALKVEYGAGRGDMKLVGLRSCQIDLSLVSNLAPYILGVGEKVG